MSLEVDTPEPTADAGASPAPGTAPAAPAAQPERNFTQADVDRIAENERKRAQRWYERELQRQGEQAQPGREGAPEDPAAAYIASLVRAQVEGATAPLRQQQAKLALDHAMSVLSERYQDFKTNQREILELLVDKGLDRITHLPFDDILDMAYHSWRANQAAAKPPLDIEAIKKQAADEAIKHYTAKKIVTTETQPKPEGAGGAAPLATKRPKGRKEFGAALEAALSRIET